MGKFTGNPNQFDGKNQFVSCKLSLKPIHFNMAFSSFSGRGKPIAFSVAAATFPAARQGAWRDGTALRSAGFTRRLAQARTGQISG